MTPTAIILSSAAGILLVSFLVIFLRSRSTSSLSHQYSDALLAENNGDLERAIHLYQEALHQSLENKSGDKRLMDDIRQRLKTLRISTDFEKSFRGNKLIA
jgi:hypothetical protein